MPKVAYERALDSSFARQSLLRDGVLPQTTCPQKKINLLFSRGLAMQASAFSDRLKGIHEGGGNKLIAITGLNSLKEGKIQSVM